MKNGELGADFEDQERFKLEFREKMQGSKMSRAMRDMIKGLEQQKK